MILLNFAGFIIFRIFFSLFRNIICNIYLLKYDVKLLIEFLKISGFFLILIFDLIYCKICVK